MTGGGDLDEGEHDVLDESDDVGDEVSDVDEIDEAGGTGDGEAAAPVGVNPQITDADSDPTAGASDIGGRAGDFDEGPTGS